MWEAKSFLAWVAFAVLHGVGRTEPAPLGHLPTYIVVGTVTVLLPITVWI